MNKPNRKTEVVTAILVIEAILSIILSDVRAAKVKKMKPCPVNAGRGGFFLQKRVDRQGEMCHHVRMVGSGSSRSMLTKKIRPAGESLPGVFF